MIAPGAVSHSHVLAAAVPEQISFSSIMTPTRNGFFFAKIQKCYKILSYSFFNNGIEVGTKAKLQLHEISAIAINLL